VAVILANTELSVSAHAHPYARDAHGDPIVDPDAAPTVRGPYPGAVSQPEGPADGPWNLRLDPRLWPVAAGDRVTAADGRVFVLRPDPKLEQLPGYDDIDFIHATGDLDPPLTR